MKTDLLDLLGRSEIIHPSRIAAVEAGHRELRITIAGYPWWRPSDRDEEGRIVFSFEGVEEGVMDAATLLDMEENEALELLRVSRLADEPWVDGGTSYAIYCSEPLHDPLRLFAIVEDYLGDAGAPRSARDYLNVPDGKLARFCDLTATASFCVAEVPKALHDIVVAVLRDQGIAHNVLVSERPAKDGIYVQIGASRFVCAGATAES